MNLESFGEVANYVVPAATVAGCAVGVLGETLALRHIKQNREAALVGYQDVDLRVKSNRLLRPFATLALIGAAVGFSAGEAATATSTVEMAGHAAITIAMDQSRMTTIGGVNNEMDKIAETIHADNGLSETWVSSSASTSLPVSYNKLINTQPFGQPSIDQGYATATAVIAGSNNGVNKAEAIVVLTDGNDIGGIAQIKSEDATNTPTYIVNFGNNADKAALSQAAISTGGKYINAKSVDQVMKGIKHDISPKPIKEKVRNNPWPWVGISAFLAAVDTKYFFHRRKHSAVTTSKSRIKE